MFESTSDKVLRVLIDCDNVFDISEKFSLIKKALPKLSQAQIDSAIADLRKENLIIVDTRAGKIFDIAVQPYALSRLTDKRNFKIWNIKMNECYAFSPTFRRV